MAAGECFSGSGSPGYVWDLAISDAGTVFFLGSFSGGLGIFTPFESLVQTGDIIAGKTITDFFSSYDYEGPFFSISHEGKLVFAATFKPYAPRPYLGGEAIFSRSELVAQADPSLIEFYSPVINDAGMVVFGVDDGGFFVIESPSGQLFGCGEYDHFPAINDAGSIVSHSERQFGPNGICPVAHDRYLLPGSMIGGRELVSIPYAAPAINNPGTVLFQASFAAPNAEDVSGLFTSTELLLQSGDTVGGKTVSGNPFLDVYFSQHAISQHAINDAGAIVFETTFTDGTSGIVKATPISSGIAGDVNGDGAVDCTDLAIIKALFGRTFGQAGFDPRADTNGDGIIDVRDLAFVAQHVSSGASCP